MKEERKKSGIGWIGRKEGRKEGKKEGRKEGKQNTREEQENMK